MSCITQISLECHKCWCAYVRVVFCGLVSSSCHAQDRSRDSLLIRAPDSRSEGCKFESWQEWRENFLLRSELCALTLNLVSIPPPCYCRDL